MSVSPPNTARPGGGRGRLRFRGPDQVPTHPCPRALAAGVFASPLGRNNPDLSGRGTGHTWARPRRSPPSSPAASPLAAGRSRPGCGPRLTASAAQGWARRPAPPSAPGPVPTPRPDTCRPACSRRFCWTRSSKVLAVRNSGQTGLSLAGSQDKETGAPVPSDSTCVPASAVPELPGRVGCAPPQGRWKAPHRRDGLAGSCLSSGLHWPVRDGSGPRSPHTVPAWASERPAGPLWSSRAQWGGIPLGGMMPASPGRTRGLAGEHPGGRGGRESAPFASGRLTCWELARALLPPARWTEGTMQALGKEAPETDPK